MGLSSKPAVDEEALNLKQKLKGAKGFRMRHKIKMLYILELALLFFKKIDVNFETVHSTVACFLNYRHLNLMS